MNSCRGLCVECEAEFIRLSYFSEKNITIVVYSSKMTSFWRNRWNTFLVACANYACVLFSKTFFVNSKKLRVSLINLATSIHVSGASCR